MPKGYPIDKPAPKIPEAFAGLPDRTWLGSRDIAEIFGRSRATIGAGIKLGTIPPCERHLEGLGSHRYVCMRWRLGAVREFIAATSKEK